MKKISLTFCLALLSSLFCPAQVSPLRFNKNGEFKIVQFTDIHFKYGNPASDIALKRIGEVLDAERPDLVVFTGDVVYAAPADTAMRKVLSYATDVKGYDWLTFDQVNWYRRQSAAYKAKNGGQPLPALAFFHIPLPEYNEAASDENAILIGTRMEKACAPELNTGMFTAMKEAGDVMGMFVGHDHDNDYAVMWKGILLAYGRFTGGNTEYNHLSNGARVIVMKEGARTFTTWIRLKGGEIIDKTVYPDSYMKDDWRKRPLVTE